MGDAISSISLLDFRPITGCPRARFAEKYCGDELAIPLSPPLIKRKHSEALFFDFPRPCLSPLSLDRKKNLEDSFSGPRIRESGINYIATMGLSAAATTLAAECGNKGDA